MSIIKKLSVLAVVVFALGALGVANASAATKFTATAKPAALSGKQLETQKFKTNGGTVECNTLAASGTVEKLESTEQEATVTYSGCSAFGFPVDNITATYLFTANGSVHVQNEPKITVTGGIFGECTVTVAKQTVNGVTYDNNGGKIKITPNPVKGIKYTSSGGICGASGENGEYSGASEVEEAGGNLSVD
jgi:hypothetical protein